MLPMKSILGNSRKPDIVFKKSGIIEITAHLAKLLNMNQGDAIDLLSDDGEIYIFVKHRNPIGRYPAMVYRSNKHGNHFRTWSTRLSSEILNICGVSDIARLAVGEPIYNFQDIDIALPLITRRIL